MKNIKTIISLVLVMAMMTSVALAIDVNATIVYKGNHSVAGSEYHERDLFDGFKNVMPGDELTEHIKITNASSNEIKLSMSMILHDDENLPEYNKEYATSEGKKDETVASMHEFVSELTMEIYNGEDTSAECIFKAEKGSMTGLLDSRYLGYLDSGASTYLTVVLKVPADLGNKFSNRVGEVDWVFHVEEIPEDEPDPDPDPSTSSTTTSAPTTGSTEPTEEITDPDIPLNPVDPDGPDSPDTGDHSNMLPYIVMFIIGLMGLILTSKKRKTN